jgi:hypothetical protein
VKQLGHPGFVILDRDCVKELFTAGETEMIFLKAAIQDTDFRHTFSADIFDMTHTRAIHFNLNANLPALMIDIMDEATMGVGDEFGGVVTKGTLCKISLMQIGNVYEKVLRLVARQVSCVFVGSPLCSRVVKLTCIGRNVEYLQHVKSG